MEFQRKKQDKIGQREARRRTRNGSNVIGCVTDAPRDASLRRLMEKELNCKCRKQQTWKSNRTAATQSKPQPRFLVRD